MRADDHDAAGGIFAHAGEYEGECAVLMQPSQIMSTFGMFGVDELLDLGSPPRCCS